MSLPYFPLFPTDFEADTSHLTLAEDGAYNRLLRLCWTTAGCSIPTDETWIMRRMRATSDDDQEAVRAVLAEFFITKKGRYTNARLSREWRDARGKHERRKKAGKMGGNAKALKHNENAATNAKAMLWQPEPEPEPLKREPKGSPKKRAERLPENWELPRAWGEWALGEGVPEASVRTEAEKFKDYWIALSGQKAAKLDWQATWRNWIRKWKDDNPNRQSPNGPSGRRDPHGALAAGFGAVARGDVGTGSGTDASMRNITPAGGEGMADGEGYDAPQSFLRLAHDGSGGAGRGN